ncbi:uncharacterized protein, partial [Atheta coriaria]|uniref:uncharacterized protein n=1 Tax=Dalotia coriaria TaxID=877792 RepID=UPI0031F474C7
TTSDVFFIVAIWSVAIYSTIASCNNPKNIFTLFCTSCGDSNLILLLCILFMLFAFQTLHDDAEYELCRGFPVDGSLLSNMASMDNTNLTLTDDYDAAEETQHTFCKIATEELQATANATITRELKGVCTSKELKRAMAVITRDIQTLKDALIVQSGGAGVARQIKRNKRKIYLTCSLFLIHTMKIIC